MERHDLFESYGLHEFERESLPPAEAFKLGFEFAEVYLNAQYMDGPFSLPVRKENAWRVEQLLVAIGRSYNLTWSADREGDRLTLHVHAVPKTESKE